MVKIIVELITGENDKGRRLDRILRKALPGCPLPLLHRLLRQGQVFTDGKPGKAQDHLDSGVLISIPSLKDGLKPASKDGKMQPPEILWQGCGLVAVNKPSGLEVHGRGSLNDMVQSYLADKLPPSLSFTPGPLHRLDKPSSGIVVFSANLEGARLFSSLLRDRQVKKTYLAIVEGIVEKEAVWEDCLVRDKEEKKTYVAEASSSSAYSEASSGKSAVTMVKPLAAKNGCSLIVAEIATGRTHQIRAQAAAHKHVLLGDKKYGSSERGGFFLHAWKLEFMEYVIEAPPNEPFKKKLKECGLQLPCE